MSKHPNSYGDRESLFKGTGGDPLSQGSPIASRGKAWGVPKETEETKDLQDNEILTLQQRRMADQDKTLDVLGDSVSRLKHIGQEISTEADEHLALLGDIEEKVDRTNVKVKNTAMRVDKIIQKSSTKCMWVTIFVLLLGLIVVVILAFHTK